MEKDSIFVTEEKDFIKYIDVKDVSAEEFFNNSEMSVSVFRNKYIINDIEKTPADVFWRIAVYIASAEKTKQLRDYWSKRWFHEMYTGQWMPGGSIIEGAANPSKISMLNCSGLRFGEDDSNGDTLEDIYDTTYALAKCAAYRQGTGVVFNLRPKGMKIRNSARESSGNVHWMKYVERIGEFVGAKGRKPALLLALKDSNPDLIDFIKCKENGDIENANNSVHWSDKFMRTLKKDGMWTMFYETEHGDKMEVKEKASVIFDLFVNSNYNRGDPGAQFIDVVKKYSNCLLGDTLVCTTAGKLPIEKIHELIQKGGESIYALSYNIEKNVYEHKKIVNSWQERNDLVYKLTVKNDKDEIFTMNSSYDHPVYTRKRGYVQVWNVSYNDEIGLYNGSKVMEYGKLTDFEWIWILKRQDLFDIEVKDNHNFVINEGMLVKNSDYLGNDDYQVRSSNPCSEQFVESSGWKKTVGVCVLGSANFGSLPSNISDAKLILNKHVAPSMCRFLDDVVTKEIDDKRYAIPGQLNSLKALRRIGAGVTNLDGYLIKNNIGYDTDEGFSTITGLVDYFSKGMYQTSINLGKEKGSFDLFNKDKYLQAPFVKNMVKRWGFVIDAIRNVCCTSMAPVGSGGLLYSEPCTSSGVEPVMGFYYWKRERTSGNYEWSFVVPGPIRKILMEKGIDLSEYGMKGDSVKDNDGVIGEKIAKIIDKHFPKDRFKPAHEIDPFKKVDLMSVLLKNSIDSAISVTYNLPENIDKKTIRDLYIYGWEKELKSMTIYRDKSRVGIVEFESPRIVEKRFIEKNGEKKYSEIEEIKSNTAPKRPVDLNADVYNAKVKGEDWIAFVGLFFGKPFEIFAGKAENINLSKKVKKGVIQKSKGKYYFFPENSDDKIGLNKDFMDDEDAALTRQISLNLRHGTPIVFISDQLTKRERGGVTDVEKVIGRVLKKYVKKEDVNGKIKCSNCNSRNLDFVEGCLQCLDCQYSKC